MTYIEWRDELAACLAGISDQERKKIFDYYAEMYADKRDAGLTEKQIILEFGAPYDVAKRILDDMPQAAKGENAVNITPKAAPIQNSPTTMPQTQHVAQQKADSKVKKYVAIVALIIGFAALVCTEIYMLIYAAAFVIDGFICLICGDKADGLVIFGLGVILTGIAVILIALFTKLEKNIIANVKNLRSGKEESA